MIFPPGLFGGTGRLACFEVIEWDCETVSIGGFGGPGRIAFCRSIGLDLSGDCPGAFGGSGVKPEQNPNVTPS